MPSRPSFADFLASNVLVLDGGLATLLESHGHKLNDSLWSARLLRDDPAAIVEAHSEFFNAGADIATTASYQAAFSGFRKLGLTNDNIEELLRLSVRLARDAQPPDRTTFIAASVGPYAVVRADGSEYTGDYGDTSDDHVQEEQGRRIRVLEKSGADVLAIETVPNAREARILCEILRDVKTPVWMSFVCKDSSHISDGTPLKSVIDTLMKDKPGCLVAVGVNCTPPEFISPLLDIIRSTTDLPIIVYPNWGRDWDAEKKEWKGHGCEVFEKEVLDEWRSKGARIIGGCCGIGCSGIAGIRSWVDGLDSSN